MACGGPKTPPNTDNQMTPTSVPTMAPETTATAEATATAAATAAATAEPVVEPNPRPVRVAFGLSTPESVLYDEEADRYLVSNINGKPVDDDNNGFISIHDPNEKAKVGLTKFIEGGKDKTKLSAPKGMAISKGVLYVADINVVRMFDRKTGAPKGEVAIEGATFLNDVAAGADGTIYVSDSGLNAEFKPTGTDAIWTIKGGKAKVLFKSTDLGQPNGIYVEGKDVWVNTFGTGELYKVTDKGKVDAAKLPKGMLDGIIKGGDDLYVSSWEGSSVFVKKKGATDWAVAVSGVKAPADIGWDKKRKVLLVPRFNDAAMESYEIK
jgi:sugar lactone lactonase YvrE